MKHTLWVWILLFAGCDDARLSPIGHTDIDTLYAQVSDLADRADQAERSLCELYRQHAELQPRPLYCVKQLPPPPYTIQ